jgi:glycosyltransferase involved in cell wall biosynthesis
MACSNLVIAHDNPFNREVLGDCGLYWSTREEVASIVDAVDGLSVDADWRKKSAMEIICTRYTWDKITNAYLAALHNASNASVVARASEGQHEATAPVSRLRQER